MKKNTKTRFLLPGILRVKTLQVIPVILFCLMLVVAPSMVFSQNLDDFKSGAQSRGVESIPFSSLRGDAGSINRDIESWKEKTASFQKWETYERKKIENYKQIRLENDDLKKRQEYVASLKSKNVDASQFEKELDPINKKIKNYKEEIEAINYEISKAIDAWDRLGRLRGGLREKFDDVLYKLADAKSSPNRYLGSNPTEEDKRKLIGYINDIEAGIKSQLNGHAEAEKACFNAKQNMENVLRRNSE